MKFVCERLSLKIDDICLNTKWVHDLLFFHFINEKDRKFIFYLTVEKFDLSKKKNYSTFENYTDKYMNAFNLKCKQ